jgi:hypothetical protein
MDNKDIANMKANIIGNQAKVIADLVERLEASSKCLQQCREVMIQQHEVILEFKQLVDEVTGG